MMADTFHTKVTVVIKATSTGEKARTGLRVLGLWPPSACTQVTTEVGLAEPRDPQQEAGTPRVQGQMCAMEPMMGWTFWARLESAKPSPQACPQRVLLTQGTCRADLQPGGG